MSWADSYREQAEAHRKEAHAWATHGREQMAQQHLDMADIYEKLAEEHDEYLRSISR